MCCAILVWNGGGGSVANTAEQSFVNDLAFGTEGADWNRLRILAKLR